MKRSGTTAALLATTALLIGLSTPSASAMAPLRSTSSFHHTNPDIFDQPGSPSCDFPVVGDWDIRSQETDYFDQSTGDLKMIVIFDHFDGTLSNPLTGKSMPDTGQGRFTIYFAPDGSVTGVLSQVSSQNPLSPVHGLTVYDADENIVKDVGRDYLSYNKHPFSIDPLCAALG